MGAGEEVVQQYDRRTRCSCGLEAVWTVQDCQESLVVDCTRFTSRGPGIRAGQLGMSRTDPNRQRASSD